MVKKLGVMTVDNHGRAQIPVQVRRYLGVGATDKISVWIVDEKIVLEKSMVGTPTFFALKPGFRGIPAER